MLIASQTSLAVEHIVETLESDIIFGRLHPHQELIEDELIGRFSAKRHIVRSAIQELVARQLVIKPRSKSAQVKNLTPVEVNEVYFMRELLQREAAHIMPLPVHPEALDALKEIHVRYVTAVTIGASPELIHKLNDEFHTYLFSLCQNATLCQAITFYTKASNLIRSYGIMNKAWLRQAVEEHAAMMAAIEARDRSRLEELVVRHMQPTRQRWEQVHVRV